MIGHAGDRPLSVLADGTIRINKDPVTKGELADRLKRIFAARTDNVLFFDAADELAYGTAMEVLDTARAGGAASIAVLTAPAR
jgi:biopolymer transport protein ExbD/biopolymer transport protein TolR